MKKLFVLMIAGALLLSPSISYAEHGGHGDCGKKCAFKKGGHGGGEEYQCPITAKFMKKAHFYLENETALGLSEQQVETIKDLKFTMEKGYTQSMAGHQLLMLDVMNALSKPEIDVPAIHALMDQQIPEMAAFAKETVTNFAKLKSVLSKEQAAKAKELWSAKKAG